MRIAALVSTLSVVVLCACRSDDRTLPPALPDKPLHTQSTLPDLRPVIVALGDSLTAGHRLSESESYPAKLQKRLDALGYRYRVINAGVSGDTTAQGLNRLQVVLDVAPKIVIVELGPNDGLRGLRIQGTRQNLEEIIRRCQAAGAVVLLAGMTLPPNWTPDYIRAFEHVFTELAAKFKLPLIPFFLEGVATRAELNLDDGIHPNAAGYDIVTENVLRSLKPLLQEEKAIHR